MRTIYITFPPACDLWKLQDALEKQGINVDLRKCESMVRCRTHSKDAESVRWFVIGWIAGAMAS